MNRRSALVAALAAAVLLAAIAAVAPVARSSAPQRPIPVLAYYYIWFNPQTWSHGKSDYPLLGRYSSDDVRVLRQHVVWAKQAGIDGFIVSWKHTPALDRACASSLPSPTA